VRAYPLTHAYAKNGDFSIQTPKLPHKQGLLEVYEFSLTGVFEARSVHSHYEDTKNIN